MSRNGDTHHLVVVKYFIRVMKNHDMYKIFRKSFNRVLNSHNNEANPFGKFEDVYQLSNGLNKFTNNNSTEHSFRNCRNEYDRITMMINHLLHFFLENCGTDPRKLGTYGQEIFDLSCFKIFGDKYLKDMEEMDKKSNIPNPRNDKEAWLISVYLSKVKKGEFMGNYSDFMQYVADINHISYDEFIGVDNNE